jgi:hypothetical protein
MAKVDFINELKALGFNPQELSPGPADHIMFEYEIPMGVGPNEGKKIMIGTIVNDSYPNSPPSAPHYRSQGIPGWINSNKGLLASSFGGEWVYWSRNMGLWSTTDRNAKAFLSIVQTILFRMNEI